MPCFFRLISKKIGKRVFYYKKDMVEIYSALYLMVCRIHNYQIILYLYNNIDIYKVVRSAITLHRKI